MNFQEANKHLQENKKICRLSWRGYSRIIRSGEKILLCSDFGTTKWRPNASDFVGTDWELWHDKIEYTPRLSEEELELEEVYPFDLFEMSTANFLRKKKK